MAFDPADAKGFIEQHPLGVAVGGLAVVLVIWWMVASGSSSSSQTAAQAPATDPTGAAATVAAAQIAANAQTAQIAAAGAASNVNAYYTAATEITATNASTLQTDMNVQGATITSGQNDIAAEFATLASTFASFGQSLQGIVNPQSTNQSTNSSTTTSTTGSTTTSTVNNASTSATSSGTPGANASWVSSLFSQFSNLLTSAFQTSAQQIHTPPWSGIGPGFAAFESANLAPLSGGPTGGALANSISATSSGGTGTFTVQH